MTKRRLNLPGVWVLLYGIFAGIINFLAGPWLFYFVYQREFGYGGYLEFPGFYLLDELVRFATLVGVISLIFCSLALPFRPRWSFSASRLGLLWSMGTFFILFPANTIFGFCHILLYGVSLLGNFLWQSAFFVMVGVPLFYWGLTLLGRLQ